MSCKNVILFYERHDEKAAAVTIKNLTPFLKNIGIKSYCFEEPSDRSKERLIATYEKIIMNIDPKGIYFGLGEAIKETIALIKETDDVNLHFCAMDMPELSREELESRSINVLEKYHVRTEYMKNKIIEQCENEKGDVSALLGSSHFKLADLLVRDGINVKEYYIISSPAVIAEDDIGDLCLLTDAKDEPICDNHKLNGLVIDLYNDPDLDAVQLITNDLRTLSTAQHDEL